MAGELALRGVELKLFAGIGDIEVAHRELADAIGRAEGSPLNALHRLTNRFLVFVPNGLVVHDATQLREPVLFVKRESAGLAPAPADTTAKDITAAALGLALELRFATATFISRARARASARCTGCSR